MVRRYIRKSQRASWSNEDIIRAMKDVLSKNSTLREAAKTYKIPLSTLHKRISRGQETVVNIGRFKPIFSPTQEREFKKHILTLERLFYGINLTEFRKLAFEYAEANKIAHKFNRIKKMAGEQWATNFLRRVGGLSIRTPEPTSLARIAGFSRTQVDVFFKHLRELKNRYNFQPDNIYSLDETGVTVVQRPKKIIAAKGKKQVGRATSAERGQTATVVACVNAYGSFIPPVIIYKRVRMNPLLLNGAISGTIGIPSSTGWIDTDIFYKVLEHFIKSTHARKDDPKLLIVDGHSSHKSLKAIELCREHGIIMLTLPPHTTNRMQPLDLTVFGPFKSYLNSEMDTWMINNPGKRITEYDMGPMLASAFKRAAIMDNITHGFEKAGIHNFNPNIFTDSDFAPAEALNPRAEGNSSQQGTSDEISIAHERTPDREHERTPEREHERTPEREHKQQHLEISVSDIFPLPHAKHQPAKKTKRLQQKSDIITSSPYKQGLVEKEAKKSKVTRNISAKLSTSGLISKKTKKLEKCNTSVDEDCTCLYCDETYSSSVNEQWIRCEGCRKWSHEACTDAESTTEAFLCDFCRA